MAYSNYTIPPTITHFGSVDASHIQDLLNTFETNVVPTTLNASTTISAHTTTFYMITATSAATITLGAPNAGSPSIGGDDGVTIEFSSDTAFSHVISATALLDTGTDAQNSITFNPFKGCSVTLVAYNGRWKVYSQNGVSYA